MRDEEFYPSCAEEGGPAVPLTLTPPPNTISFNVDNGATEILRFGPDGSFYVRGERVPVDESEGRRVFNAFCEWLNTVNKERCV